MSIRLSDIPDIDATGKTELLPKTKGIRLSDIPDTQTKFTGQPNKESLGRFIYREYGAPIYEGVSTLAAGIPRMIAKTQPGAEEFFYPEQQTMPGKLLRGASEIAGFTVGLPGQAAKLAGRGIGKVAEKVIPKFVGKALTKRVIQGAGAGAAGMATAGDTLEDREQSAIAGAKIGGAIPIAGAVGKTVNKFITKSGRWVAKNIGGITDATVATIKRLGTDRVFDPLKSKADYISQNLSPKIYNKLLDFKTVANRAYNEALNSAPEGKKIDIRSAIEEAGNRLKKLGLITEKGNLTELGNNEISRDSVYGKLLDFYKSADAISGVEKLQGQPLTQSQMIKASKAMKETLVNKDQFTFLRDKLNSLYKNKPSDIDVSKVVNEFYQSGENSGIKGLQKARELQRKVFEIEDNIDLNKITRNLVKAKNPQWTKVVQKEYEDLVDKGILTKEESKNIWDDLMAHFANTDFELVTETPGAGGGIYPSKAGMLRGAIARGTKGYYKNVAPQIEKAGKFTGKAIKPIKTLYEKLSGY